MIRRVTLVFGTGVHLHTVRNEQSEVGLQPAKNPFPVHITHTSARLSDATAAVFPETHSPNAMHLQLFVPWFWIGLR